MLSRIAGPSALLLLFSCSVSTHNPENPREPAPPPPKQAILLHLSPGTTLGLDLRIAGARSRRVQALRTWIGESLAQSPWLDVARDPDHPLRLVVQGELPSDQIPQGTLTTILVRMDAPPLPIKGVHFTGDTLLQALDQLCRRTRLALGEPWETLRKNDKSCRLLVSDQEAVAEAVGQSLELSKRGRLLNALGLLQRAVRMDRGCALGLSLLAGLRLDLGFPRKALELVLKMKDLERRASPTALHRAARVWLMANQSYEGLLGLAEKDLALRPYDPNILFTKALALSLQARWKEALPLLRRLRVRLPQSPGLLFCLGHALLAQGKGDEAQKILPQIQKRLPAWPALRFEALVQFHRGDYASLNQLLEDLRRKPLGKHPRVRLEISLMQASLWIQKALQEGEQNKSLNRAGRRLLEAVTQLRSQPRNLVNEQTLLPGLAWTMIQMGMAKSCRQALATLPANPGRQKKRNAPALVALSLCDVAQGKTVGKAVARDLDSMGLGFWNKRLLALRLEKEGRFQMALSLLRDISGNTKDPSLIYDIIKIQKQLGNLQEFMPSLGDLEKKLWTPRMDKPRLSPLLSPKRSFILFKIAQMRGTASVKKY
ncbi:MAG TPA: hypothetical protein ENK02_05985 [Planctomycetes bacterium]|nr:hypothetical protein [Planctomycetota bacterium]